jgi:hypothetical protein
MILMIKKCPAGCHRIGIAFSLGRRRRWTAAVIVNFIAKPLFNRASRLVENVS